MKHAMIAAMLLAGLAIGLMPFSPRAIADEPESTPAPKLDLPPRPVAALEWNGVRPFAWGSVSGTNVRQKFSASSSEACPQFPPHARSGPRHEYRPQRSRDVLRHTRLSCDRLRRRLLPDSDDPFTAQKLADRLGRVLPTPKMVDDIYAAAAVKLTPASITPSAAMTTVPVFLQHNTTVRDLRRLEGQPLSALTAGHKKDVVIANSALHHRSGQGCDLRLAQARRSAADSTALHPPSRILGRLQPWHSPGSASKWLSKGKRPPWSWFSPIRTGPRSES